MRIDRRARTALMGPMLGGVLLGATGPAKAPLLVVAAIEPGQWELREQGATGAPRQLCVTNPDMLVQFEHNEMVCTRFVVDNQPMSATVTYDCRGAGRGRTVIRAESTRLFHLDTQGVSGGAPFDMSFEGRRTGACAANSR